MARYIDADKLDVVTGSVDSSYDTDSYIAGMTYVLNIIDNIPTADVVEVVHGKWEKKWDNINERYYMYCSNCGKQTLFEAFATPCLSDYCRCCGAKMDKERD